jgi:hypothetical protein
MAISDLIAELAKEGIGGLAKYETRLRQNASNRQVLRDLLFEADVAVMLSRNEFKVTIRDSPDIRFVWNEETAYAEVKHFREKNQDRKDERAMRSSEDLVPVGVLTPSEGSEAWDQLAKVAVSKLDQYKEGAANILVVASDSNSVNGTILSTAVHLYDEQARSDQRLRRLNGFVLIDQWYRWLPEQAAEKNVYFCETAGPTTALSKGLAAALANIRRWSTPRIVANALSL